eukprot:1337211-Ditylum_brightwellii.AAC.1
MMSIPGHADMFVDDNTLMHNNSVLNASATQLMQTVQHDAELLGRLLWMTGVLLEILKSSYFLAILKFSAKGEPSITFDLPPNMVQLTDAQDLSTKLKRFSPADGIEMMGSGKQQHFKNIQKKNTYKRNWASL